MEKLKLKTLVVSFSLPPALVGSSSIIANLAKGFSADEMVLAGELWPGPENNHWNDENGTLPSVHFIHKQWPWKFKKLIRLLLFPIILWRLCKLFKKTDCQQVLAIFPNEIYTCMALFVAKWYRVPFYSYFHNTYLDNRTGFKKRFAQWLQPKVFDRSRIVFVMSDGMKVVMEKEYPDVRFMSLVHSFCEEVNSSSEYKPIPDRSLRIAFMGSLNSSNFDAFSRLKQVLDHFPECHLTTYSRSGKTEFAEFGATGPNVEHTSVEFDQVVDSLKKHDLLFLPHGFEGGFKPIEYETIFPTRTIPYLLAGVPILAHSPPNAFLTRWLKTYDCAEVVESKEKGELTKAVIRLIDSKSRQKTIVDNAKKAVEQFHISNVATLLRTTINRTNKCAE